MSPQSFHDGTPQLILPHRHRDYSMTGIQSDLTPQQTDTRLGGGNTTGVYGTRGTDDFTKDFNNKKSDY
ncbi:hypothetical protein [Tunicatimonas pelagia]|uniref:hypothetical protein n=1 Tax=Tunicatimonas pelagia TaxID=931531 RepID=UPI002666FD70|nr:hypothetical protein [Tunicatimonas pelagia]WKN43722.1 hypothetical protein P0M28_01895 [Tunicatimonas pelagia]